MGISGHILGDRKLRQLQRLTGLPFDRAYRYHDTGGARLIDEDGRCRHYIVNFRTGEALLQERTIHWSSCPPQIIDLDQEFPPEERAKYEALFTEEVSTPARIMGPAVVVRRKAEEGS